jgi:hypothetical protein
MTSAWTKHESERGKRGSYCAPGEIRLQRLPPNAGLLELERANSKTFKVCAEAFYEQNAARWRNERVRGAFLPRMERWAFP